MSKKTITIGLEGGLIQWIEGIPEDVRVVVQDYDIEVAGVNAVAEDKDGQKCIISTWENDEEDKS